MPPWPRAFFHVGNVVTLIHKIYLGIFYFIKNGLPGVCLFALPTLYKTHTHTHTHTHIYIYIYIYICVCVVPSISFQTCFVQAFKIGIDSWKFSMLLLEAVVMRQLRRWKRLWQRSLTRSHKRTSMGYSRICLNGTTSAFQPEEIISKGIRVSCVYYQ